MNTKKLLIRQKRKAVFLDRDGVINELVFRGEDFLVANEKVSHTAPFFLHELKIKNEIIDSIIKIKDMGFLCILVTNQPDVYYGVMQDEEYHKIMSEISKLPLDDIFVCRHGRDENCQCKKPKTGMFIKASKKWDIDFEKSFMVGDSDTDILAGRHVGCTTVLVKDCELENVDYHHRISHLSELSSILVKYS
ncbi:MAG: HAD-IIIA family hydrolase [Minisyncoccia bacterium]